MKLEIVTKPVKFVAITNPHAKIPEVVHFEVPEEIKWLAVDLDGDVYGYTERPFCDDGCWYARRRGSHFIFDTGKHCENWRDTLIEVK